MNQSVHNSYGADCPFCLFCDSCTDTNLEDVSPCEHFSPTDEDAYGDMMMEQLREERLIERIQFGRGENFKWALGGSVNNYLMDLRSGHLVFTDNKEMAAEILRFEPDSNVVCKDGVFYISF